MSSLWYVFLPRYFAPDKPDENTGRLFNHAFAISESPYTFISTGANGELYWSYGWSGLVLGMTAIGLLLGATGVATDLDVRTNLPRFLVLVVTAYLLCVRFEVNLSLEYTYWLRTVAMLAVIHLFMPKARVELAQPAGFAQAAPHQRFNFVALPATPATRARRT